MAEQDNTPAASEVQAPDITNQETLDKALQAEPVTAEAETEAVKEGTKAEDKPELSKKDDLILGKYKTLDDFKDAYANLQARSTKAEQALKELKKQMEGKTREEIKGLDYDKQFEFLLNKIQELEDFKAGIAERMEAETAQSVAQTEEQAIDAFIAKNPLLKETDLDEEFRLIATHPSMQEFTLDSIYNVRIAPKLEKLMGTKITTKERKLLGSTTKPEPAKFEDVSKMTPAEYEKNRQKILAEAGIK